MSSSSSSSSFSLEPLGDRIIVETIEEPDTTVGGIFLPGTAQEAPQRGNVLAVGDGVRNFNTGDLQPLLVNVGDVVIYSKYGGVEVKVEGKEYLILRESDILAKAKGLS